jgi:hypothetical protein
MRQSAPPLWRGDGLANHNHGRSQGRRGPVNSRIACRCPLVSAALRCCQRRGHLRLDSAGNAPRSDLHLRLSADGDPRCSTSHTRTAFRHRAIAHHCSLGSWRLDLAGAGAGRTWCCHDAQGAADPDRRGRFLPPIRRRRDPRAPSTGRIAARSLLCRRRGRRVQDEQRGQRLGGGHWRDLGDGFRVFFNA